MALRTMKSVFGFEVDPVAEADAVDGQLIGASTILWNEIAATDRACEIFHAHVQSEDEHSCIGCNLNDAVHDLTEFLISTNGGTLAPLLRLHLALSLVNVIWERISDICTTLKVPDELWRHNKFAAFQLARKWANFMKHPGFFGLGIHHPLYVAGGSPASALAASADDKRPSQQTTEWVLIDSDFVSKYWSSDKGSAELDKVLREPCTACVVLPDLERMAPDLCAEFNDFVERMKEKSWVELARRHAVTELPCDWW